MQDYGSLLTMKQAARVLFGESNDNARKRAIALLKRNDVDLIKNGRSHLVRRDVLQKRLGSMRVQTITPNCVTTFANIPNLRRRGCDAPSLKILLKVYQRRLYLRQRYPASDHKCLV